MKTIITTILLAILMTSCLRVTTTTRYKVISQGRNYYTNHIDTTATEIHFFEPKRDGVTPHFYYSVKLNNIVAIKDKNHDKNINSSYANSYTRIDSSFTAK